MASSRLSGVLVAVFACLLGVALPASARAENNCPLLNEATASDIIGGAAVGSYVADQGKPAVCTFTQTLDGATRVLEISVSLAENPHAMYLATLRTSCHSTTTPLKAIGNEAVTCAVQRRGRTIGMRVVGRVRDQVFLITLSSTVTHDTVLTPAMLGMKISTTAEEVSGNLF